MEWGDGMHGWHAIAMKVQSIGMLEGWKNLRRRIMEILPAEDIVVGVTLPRFTHTEGIRAPHLLAGFAGLVVQRKDESLAGVKALRPVRSIPSL